MIFSCISDDNSIGRWTLDVGRWTLDVGRSLGYLYLKMMSR
ncbi:hypothetical protein Q7381_01260 [Glaesserella parasuis]|nr:hypothetical protein [Glaesserella parasuis]MDO9968588.1 hypothetical protein [Glaesserella parasuis]MDP0119020.1 hypothetical protein [Glaesserella parasuis]